jgi:iron complex outermembrane recepter protein
MSKTPTASSFVMRRVALAAAAVAATAAPAWAQTTAAPAVVPGQLQTITVTAERRLENIRDVPSSVTALQGDILEALGTSGQDVRALSGRVPSLNIESSFGRAFPRFYIRGYGNTDFRLNASQPVSLVYDDVVQENPILKGFPVFDVNRVEVLRGPQGTLFGRNTPAGVVKFDSVKPSKQHDGYGSVSVGTFRTINAEGAGNFQLGDSVSMRASLISQTRADWVKNTVATGPTQDLEGYRDNAVRLQFLIEPNRDTSVLANVHARDYSGSARLFRANIIKTGTNELVDGFDERKISIDGQNASELQNYGGSLRVRVGLGNGLSLNSITGIETVRTYSRGDIDGGFGASFLPTSGPGLIPFASESADGMPKHTQLSQELRLESGTSGGFNWQAGLFVFSEDYKIESFSYDSLAAGKQDGYLRVRQKNDALAVFGNVGFAVTPDFKLRAGLRLTRDTKKFTTEDYNSSGFAPCVGPTIGAIPAPPKCTLAQLTALEPDRDLSASPKDNKFNWDLSGTYTLTKDVNVYARAATGFRASSVQGASAFNGKSVAKPENVVSVEAGVKADLFDRRTRLNASVFNYTVKDLQLTAVGGAGNANILLSAKKATGRGFELDLQSFVTDQLLASVGVGINDTQIRDSGLSVATCAQCTVTDPTKTVNGNKVALIDGNPLPQAPKTTANFTLRYTQPVGGGDLYVFTDWVYRSKVNFFLYESAEFTGKAMTEGGLRVGYQWGAGKYDAAAFVRNITNQIRVVGGIDFNNNTGFINDPRTFGVQFKMTM